MGNKDHPQRANSSSYCNIQRWSSSLSCAGTRQTQSSLSSPVNLIQADFCEGQAPAWAVESHPWAFSKKRVVIADSGALHSPTLSTLIHLHNQSLDKDILRKHTVLKPNPNMTVFGGGIFERERGHKGGVLMIGPSALTEETPESSLIPFCHVRTQWEGNQPSMNQEGACSSLLCLIVLLWFLMHTYIPMKI